MMKWKMQTKSESTKISETREQIILAKARTKNRNVFVITDATENTRKRQRIMDANAPTERTAREREKKIDDFCVASMPQYSRNKGKAKENSETNEKLRCEKSDKKLS